MRGGRDTWTPSLKVQYLPDKWQSKYLKYLSNTLFSNFFTTVVIQFQDIIDFFRFGDLRCSRADQAGGGAIRVEAL